MAATINFADFGETGNGSRSSSSTSKTSSSTCSSGSGSFADQLTDQFLTCPLCSQFIRQPKVLNCQHTFCAECIESHYEMDESDRPYRFLLSYNRDISCPVCRTRTAVPNGGLRRLPDNFVVASLADVVTRRKPSIGAGCLRRSASAQGPTPTATCDICLIRAATSSSATSSRTQTSGFTPAAATVKCLDCVKMLCTDCANLHKRTKVTSCHVLYSVSVEQEVECKVHQNETLRFYCERCETCICVLCTFDGHSEHPVTSLLDGVQRQKAGFESLIGDCRERIESVRDQLRLIDGCEAGLQRAEDHIRDAAIEAIATVRRREAQLMSDLRRAIGEQTFAFIANRKSIDSQLDELVMACEAADRLIGRGSSVSCGVEILMNQRNIRDRLMSALDIQLRHTPEGLRRTFQLLPADCFAAEAEKSELFALASNIDCDEDVEVADSEAQTEVIYGSKPAANVQTWTEEDGVRKLLNVGCQVSRVDDLPMVRPIIVAPSIEYVHLLPPSAYRHRDSEDYTPGSPGSGPQQPSRRGSIQGRWPLEKSNSLTQEVPTPTQRQPIVWSYTLPKAAPTEMTDSCVGSDPVETSDVGVLASGPMTVEKQTSTPHVIVVHKNVSTENQVMVDKATSTAVSDVTSAYRGTLQTTTSRRSVTVSRGTTTTNPMTSDRATSPIRGWAQATPFSVTSSSFAAAARPPAQLQLQQPVAVATVAPPPAAVPMACGSGQIMIRTTQQTMTSPPPSKPANVAPPATSGPTTTNGASARFNVVTMSSNQTGANQQQQQPMGTQIISRGSVSGLVGAMSSRAASDVRRQT